MARLATLLALLVTGCASAPVEPAPELSVLAWNIWHGGREDGEEDGPQRVVEVIAESGADLVAMQETYGSGERIAQALGFHFHPRGTNVSIHSRYPIVADVSVHEPFQCVAAIVEPPGLGPLAFVSLWLPYDEEIWEVGTRAGRPAEELIAACDASATNLSALLDALGPRLTAAGYGDVPIVVAGDFNSMSHLDYVEAARDQYGYVIDWPTSRVITSRGYRDAYRARHPRVDRAADRTWTPRFPEQDQDRIDFVYDTLSRFRVFDARVVDVHPEGFPSDHAAVLVRYGSSNRW